MADWATLMTGSIQVTCNFSLAPQQGPLSNLVNLSSLQPLCHWQKSCFVASRCEYVLHYECTRTVLKNSMLPQQNLQWKKKIYICIHTHKVNAGVHVFDLNECSCIFTYFILCSIFFTTNWRFDFAPMVFQDNMSTINYQFKPPNTKMLFYHTFIL